MGWRTHGTHHAALRRGARARARARAVKSVARKGARRPPRVVAERRRGTGDVSGLRRWREWHGDGQKAKKQGKAAGLARAGVDGRVARPFRLAVAKRRRVLRGAESRAGGSALPVWGRRSIVPLPDRLAWNGRETGGVTARLRVRVGGLGRAREDGPASACKRAGGGRWLSWAAG